VKTVLARYYGPFLARFPTLKALAQATAEEVVKQWEGLGYYTRARNLHAAAQQSGGALPETVEGLMALPGIGRNTAHAIAAFAFGARVPVMEANVKRVLCRIFALETPDERVLWEKACLLLDEKHAFDHNQAMMDIGAFVCTPRSPRCGECPLAAICLGKSAPESYPQKKAKKTVPVRRRIIVAFTDAEGRYFLKRRETRFLGGLYGFMEYEAETDEVEFLGKRHTLRKAELLGAVTQVYSHFRLEAKVYLVPVRGKAREGLTAATLAEMANLPLSKADHRVVRLICEREPTKIRA